ncbi:uncharacterized protein BYT42DRAFT_558423 [Radiomyces spectabilis]|uniref:uncharacterized protein n=1 Tax=Radiomyces spectabilis TaxID=64574 RepID=UPI00221F98B9|nr:uncharacterized protein BYT42DRAFT_558423 [Radiomyces spectabilis]KAI8387963.1 hypothetical protein BYT42DRAFT_558423 [Radiomyces spectabilis]
MLRRLRTLVTSERGSTDEVDTRLSQSMPIVPTVVRDSQTSTESSEGRDDIIKLHDGHCSAPNVLEWHGEEQVENPAPCTPETTRDTSTTASSTSQHSAPANMQPRAPFHMRFYQGGVRKRHKKFVKWLGRCGFIAKGIVYGTIGVLTCTNVTGAWTPNGSQQNESPQGAFLLLGGIPTIGRSVLVVMAIGLITYIIWRFWEAFTGQGSDASFGKKKNFFRYRLSPFVSGCVYSAYTYYVVMMIFETSADQQNLASSKTFPASWTDSALGKAGISLLGIAFIIACITQIINAVTGSFINDLKTSEPNARRWEAIIVHTAGRIGFGARAAVFGSMSGFFWDSLAQRNESGQQNMVAAAINKLATNKGGKFFMIIMGVGLVDYALFAISNAYYKYFPTPPPTRRGIYENDDPNSELNRTMSFISNELSLDSHENEDEEKHDDEKASRHPKLHSFFQKSKQSTESWYQKIRSCFRKPERATDPEKQDS